MGVPSMRREVDEVLAELEAQGAIGAEQRARIRAALAARLDAPRDHSGRVIAIVATFGALLFSAGVLYLVAVNWEALGKAAKLALVFGTWGAIHAAGYALAEKPGGYPRIGRALTLAGMLCFGGALYLVAQIYNLSAHYPWAILLWWALDVPLMLWLRSRAAQVVVTGLFVTWAFMHANVWLEGQALNSWRDEARCNFALVAGLGALFGGLAALAGSLCAERYVGLWRFLAPLAALFACYLLSFEDGAHTSGPNDALLVVLAPALFLQAVALVLLLVALARGVAGPLRVEALGAQAMGIVLTGCVFAAGRSMPILGNLLELGALLLLVWHGTRARSAALVNLALGFFALVIVTRYLEYLWDKLEGAYAFLGSGALLLVLGWFLERRRRSLMRRVRGAAA
jgi:uncharacterized membrane protein